MCNELNIQGNDLPVSHHTLGKGSDVDRDDSGEEKPSNTPGDEPGGGVSTKYRLKGIVVHSGQASGGHYYSFIHVKWVQPLPVCVVYSMLLVSYVGSVQWVCVCACKYVCVKPV